MHRRRHHIVNESGPSGYQFILDISDVDEFGSWPVEQPTTIEFTFNIGMSWQTLVDGDAGSDVGSYNRLADDESGYGVIIDINNHDFKAGILTGSSLIAYINEVLGETSPVGIEYNGVYLLIIDYAANNWSYYRIHGQYASNIISADATYIALGHSHGDDEGGGSEGGGSESGGSEGGSGEEPIEEPIEEIEEELEIEPPYEGEGPSEGEGPIEEPTEESDGEAEIEPPYEGEGPIEEPTEETEPVEPIEESEGGGEE